MKIIPYFVFYKIAGFEVTASFSLATESIITFAVTGGQPRRQLMVNFSPTFAIKKMPVFTGVRKNAESLVLEELSVVRKI